MTQPNKPGPSWEKEARKLAKAYVDDETELCQVEDGYHYAIKAWIEGARWAQEKAAAPGEESDGASALREEVERFMKTNTFAPMQVTNFYVQAKLALRELSTARAEVASLRKEHEKYMADSAAYAVEMSTEIGALRDQNDTLRQQRAEAVCALTKIGKDDEKNTSFRTERDESAYYINIANAALAKLKAPSDSVGDAGEGKEECQHLRKHMRGERCMDCGTWVKP